jgi:hypothetical protein
MPDVWCSRPSREKRRFAAKATSFMLDKWAKTIKVKLSSNEFHRLPQNPAYKYEYFDGQAWLTPRLKCYHAVLNLAEFQPPEADLMNEDAQIRLLEESDWEKLSEVFAAAFARVSPFASMNDNDQLAAARDSLAFMHRGGNGPIISDACLVVVDPHDGSIVGGFLVTLVPDLPLSDIHFGHVPEKRLPPGQKTVPHLTWVFVKVWHARHGVATALLSRGVAALRELGHTRLTTTFLLGNESSTLWHWRMGFRLASYPMSQRQFERRAAKDLRETDAISDQKPKRTPAKR